MDADLVGTPSLEVNLGQAGPGHRLDDVVVGDGLAPALDDGHLPLPAGVTADGGVDGAAGGIEVALHQGVVHLVHGVLPEGTFEHRVGPLPLGHDHDARGAYVQARDDALALGGAGGGHSYVHGLQGAEDVGAVPPHGGVRGHARGLVDDDDVLILVEQLHALHGSGDRFDGTGVGQVDLEELARAQTRGFGQRLAASAHLSGLAQVLHPATGQPRHPGQRGIDAFAVEAVGDGQQTHAHCGSTEVACVDASKDSSGLEGASARSFPRVRDPRRIEEGGAPTPFASGSSGAPARVPSISQPPSDRMMMPAAAATMAMSATLPTK